MRISSGILTASSAALLSIALNSCIHTYPDGEGYDPTLVKAGVEVTVDINWETQDIFLTKSEPHDYRLIIEFERNGSVFGRCTHRLSQEKYASGTVKLVMPFDFHAVNYKVTGWIDCLNGESIDSHYDAEDLTSIRRADNHISWSDNLECASGNANANLQQYKDNWNAKAIIPLVLSSPIGRFRFVATDSPEFRDYISEYVAKGETYHVMLAFSRRVAHVFNAIDNVPSQFLESPEYYFPFPASGSEIASGALFVGSEVTEASARILVYNSARLIVSKSPVITFPVIRGKVTTISGEMLTDYYTNSINVNNIWDGEIIVEL